MKGAARRRAVALIALSSWLGSARAFADGSTDLEALLEEKVVTSASKSAETTDSAPATATTITAEDLQRHGLRTVGEAVRFLVPGAIVEEIPGGSFGARGVLVPLDFGSHVLLLIDGHAVNSELDGSVELMAQLGVPIELVDHIEVVLGPGSVLYGSNAMFGVINVVTKLARNQRGLRLGADAEFSRQYRGMVGAGTTFDLLGERAELTLGLEHTDLTDPLRIGNQYLGNDVYTGAPLRTRADGTSDGVWGGLWKNNIARTSSGYSRVAVGPVLLSARAGMQRSNDPTNLFDFDAEDIGYRDRWLSLDLSYQKRVSENFDLKLRLYGDERRKNIRWRASAAQYCLPGQLAGCRVDIDGGAEWLGLDAQGRIDWLGDGRHTTLLGVDGRVRNVQYVSDILDAQTGANPGSVAYYSNVDTTLGAYAQHVARVSRKLAINLGGRFDSYPHFGSALSPRAAIVFEPWENGSLKAIYSSAFQAPLASNMAFAQPLLIAPAGELGNERVRSYELAAEQRLGTHALRTSLFYSRWQDMVELVQLSPAELERAKIAGQVLAFVPNGYQYRNAASIDSYGFTAHWEGSFVGRRLRYGLSLTEAFVRLRHGSGGDELLEGAPQIQGSLRLSYDLGEPWPTLGLTARATGPAIVYGLDNETYAETPTVDARVSALANVTGPVPGLGRLRYRLGARFASSRESAFPIGTLKHATPENPEPLLFPLRTFTALGGLEYTIE